MKSMYFYEPNCEMNRTMEKWSNQGIAPDSYSAVHNNSLDILHADGTHRLKSEHHIGKRNDLFQHDRNQNHQQTKGTSFDGSSPSSTLTPSKRSKRSRSLVSSSWNERFQELIQFREANDHCFVPHKYPQNPKLSQWVRKQRHQRKRKEKGLHSTLSDERQEMLTNAGFIWDSHRAQWQERYQSLEVFHMTNGHCNVPSNFHDSSLSNWVKNQRKQFKLFKAGLMTAMDEERINLLNSLGFNWNPRGL